MSFDEHWESANADGPTNNEPPEAGTYCVALIDGDAFVSKAGEDFAKLGFRDTASGHEWDVLLGFGSQGAANVAKGTCAAIGVSVDEVETLEDLASALKEHVGKFYDVTVKQNGDYRNTYIDGEATGTDVPAEMPEPEAVAAGGGSDDDEIPF